MHERRVVVIGGGIVGLATAWQLARAKPGVQVTVLEKEPSPALHQSSHNSGVLHAGLYYRPGSLKARLAVEGIREMTAFCREHGVPHETCGKLVVATDAEERTRLHALLGRGTANGLTGLRLLQAAEMREREPHVGGIEALLVPEEGIADYPAVCRTLAALIAQSGGSVRTSAGVTALRRAGTRWVASTAQGEVEADFVVGCAGLHADRVARMAGLDPGVRIVPFRGEYYALRPERRGLVRHLIYPVPDPRFPFLGVHFTRLIGGGVEAGPNAVLATAREGYRARDVDLRELAGILAYPGMMRFLRRYGGAVVAELAQSFSKARFTAGLQRLVPAITAADLEPGGAGVRAQALRPDGSMVEDFAFAETTGALFVINAPSPAATASLAIGREIAARVTLQLE